MDWLALGVVVVAVVVVVVVVWWWSWSWWWCGGGRGVLVTANARGCRFPTMLDVASAFQCIRAVPLGHMPFAHDAHPSRAPAVGLGVTSGRPGSVCGRGPWSVDRGQILNLLVCCLPKLLTPNPLHAVRGQRARSDWKYINTRYKGV